MKVLWLAGLICLPVGIRADVVHLTNGQTVKGQVLMYVNTAFEVAAAGGEVAKYQLASVKSIEFDTGTVSLDTRTKGRIQAKVTAYGDSAFSFVAVDGTTQQVAAAFVKEASFPGGGGSGQKIETITHGARVDLAKHLGAGRVTLVDFYADWCGPCRVLGPTLEQLARTDPDVVLRKVDIVNWTSEVAKQYDIHAIPHVQVYDRAGKLVGTVRGVDPDQVKAFVKKAKETTK